MKKEDILAYVRLLAVPVLTVLLGLILLFSPDTASALVGKILGWVFVLTGAGVGAGGFLGEKTRQNNRIVWSVIFLVLGIWILREPLMLAKILGRDAAALEADYAAKKTAAENLWNGEYYVSGANKQISWASQVWMVLGGAQHGDAALLKRLENCAHAEGMVTPYMYHNYVDALLAVGQKDKALEVLCAYWGGMLDQGADTFWELYNPVNPNESPYGGTIVNSYCHAWSCAPAYFLRKFY